MPDICPHCQQAIRKPKAPRLVASVDTATMTDAELFAYYKKTDRIETLRFWLRHLEHCSQELKDAFTAFAFIAQNTKLTPPAFDRQFETLKGMWRRESNARELAAHLAAGDVYEPETARWRSVQDILSADPVAESEVA